MEPGPKLKTDKKKLNLVRSRFPHGLYPGRLLVFFYSSLNFLHYFDVRHLVLVDVSVFIRVLFFQDLFDC